MLQPLSFGTAANTPGGGFTGQSAGGGFGGGFVGGTNININNNNNNNNNNAAMPSFGTAQYNTGFGGGPTISSFGQSSSSSSSGGNVFTGFGTTNNTSNLPSINTTTGAGFGTGFGTGPPSTPALSFGSSSSGESHAFAAAPMTTTTATTTNNAAAIPFGSRPAVSGPTSTLFGSGFITPSISASVAAAAAAPPPSSSFGFGFGTMSSSTPQQQPSFNSGFGSSLSSSPFVAAPPTQLSATTVGGGFGTITPGGFGQSNSSMGYGTTAPPSSSSSSFDMHIPRKSTTRMDDVVLEDGDGGGGDDEVTTMTTAAGDDQLAALRAKIQEKRKKLLKMKQDGEGQQQSQSQQRSDDNNNTALAARTALRFGMGGTSPVPSSGGTNATLAARNAVRFGATSTSSGDGGDPKKALGRLLPVDLQDRRLKDEDVVLGGEEDDYDDDVAVADIGDEGEDDLDLRILSNAKSLIGTCTFMCPDEELLRREKEGDIQLLEVTDPGGLHPKEWTLRDTAVKRFRRSAADFKLDIPDWVRPPEVLERVCAYLEEWVMERDRQGPDKRWANQPSDTPPPLDVYQFIWDRTRMIRKDYILQNYIGTGGNCDARAVRCHERIARWHAMCEHQLSHIPEFVKHQSQQNIAELGQTMKTLNNYYDDAEGRSLTEVVDSEDNLGGTQGCRSDIVMGKSPIDFDGSVLANNSQSDDVSKRIIGKNGMNSPSRGTAEPEMRGLYILLTLNNEGGMEVIKYSGRLCVEKPAIFYSKPVQLALSIFQAKKDHNYARFFSLLQSPSTPYLYACIMFKYVESMRKDALTIMSRTYGAKHKTTGEPFFDEYALEDLVKLLCYEDNEEAMTACCHYGITVKGDKVLWRHSKFTELRDPEKDHIIPLKPRKMIRTIESKLHGATRLSVCRGGVSGEGATLSGASIGSGAVVNETERKKAQESTEKAKIETMKRLMEAEAKVRAQEEMKERERIKQEKLAAETRARQEATKRAEMERLEQERLQREKILAKERQQQEEARRLAEAELLARRAEMERQEREAREREAARKQAEEDERERERQQLLVKQREDAVRRVAEIKAAEEQAAKEQRERDEMLRLADLRRMAEEDRIRKVQEEEARRIEMMWVKKIETARKILAWRLWRKQMRQRESLDKSRLCLGRLDPTFTHCPPPLTSRSLKANDKHNSFTAISENGLESQLYRHTTAPRKPIDLSGMVARCLHHIIDNTADLNNLQMVSNVFLFKLVVWLPQRNGLENLHDSLRMWVNSYLRIGNVIVHTFKRRSKTFQVRVVSVIGNEQPAGCKDYNAALLVRPSSIGTRIEFPIQLEDSNSTRMELVLDNEECGGNFNRDLEQCCEAIVKSHYDSLSNRTNMPSSFSCGAMSMVRVSIANIGFLCLQRLLQNMDSEGCFRSSFSDDLVFSACNETLVLLARELLHVGHEMQLMKLNRPPLEFCDEETNSVLAYFNDRHELPRLWHVPLIEDIDGKIFDTTKMFLDKASFVDFVEGFSEEIPLFLRQNLFSAIDNNDVTHCIVAVVSLFVNGEFSLDKREEIIYLPDETFLQMIERVTQYEVPSIPEPVLLDIPSYLYQNQIQPENYQIEDTPQTTPAVHKVATKRKAPERKLESPGCEILKRGRIRKPLIEESEEQRRSKEFTSFLESLLI